MSSNFRYKFLKQLFGKDEKKIYKEITEERERKVKKQKNDKEEKEITVSQKEKNLDITQTLRSEFHFLKFPFFDLSPRSSKKDRIEIKEIEETKEGKIEILWKVERSIDSNFPSSFARRLHKEVIEKTLNNMKKPVSQLVRLGSLRQICKKMGITESGKNCEDIKKALKDIKKASIEAKGTFRQKEKNGNKKFFEGSFNLYDMVYFAGEILPGGMEASEVYVLLNSMYIQNFNNNFVVPIDYKYHQSLAGDIGSRMYEMLSIWFYPALENGKKYINKKYSELCDYFPLTRQDTKWKAKKQLKSAHQQHLSSGFFVEEPEWININKKDDWLIRYWIGQKAKNWYKENKKLGNIKENVKQLGLPEQNRVGEEEFEKKIIIKKEEQKKTENPLVKQLTDLGVTQSVADDLAKDYSPKKIKDWIEVIHDIKAKDKPAFLVKAIKENWELPELYKKEKERKAEERQQKTKEELKSKYNKYISKQLNEYMGKKDKKILEKEIEEHKKIFLKKHPFYQQFKESGTLRTFVEADYRSFKAKEIGLPLFDQWKRQVQKKKQMELFEVEKTEDNSDFKPQTTQQTL